MDVSTRPRPNRSWIWALLAVAVFYGGLQMLGVTCPIRLVTGISCPGCGMTRAWLALLLRHSAAEAIRYHPLFWTVPPALVCFVLRKRIPSPVLHSLTILFAALLAAVYLIRLYKGNDPVVVFQPSQGLIPRGIRWIASHISQQEHL